MTAQAAKASILWTATLAVVFILLVYWLLGR